MEPKFLYCVHENPPLVHILSQINSVVTQFLMFGRKV
jgi:hypothetical protein